MINQTVIPKTSFAFNNAHDAPNNMKEIRMALQF